jgi:hypothetical protein
MFYGNQVQETRSVFFSSWKKFKEQSMLSPLEQQIVAVIAEHPEYHALFEASETPTETVYFPELGASNPFLHMGLHLAIRDQIATNKPPGISDIYQQLKQRYGDQTHVEHLLMEPLMECLWQAQQNRHEPDSHRYLLACQSYLEK